jgi:hypothetical protein
MPHVYRYQGKLGKWEQENMAAALKEVKEKICLLQQQQKNLVFPETR